MFELPADQPPDFRGLWSQSLYGTVVLEHAGPAGALNAVGWLQDEKTGFSTPMTFADPTVPQFTTLYGAQILLKDPVFGNAPVRSHILLQNTTNVTVPVSGDVIFEAPGGPVSVPFPMNAIDANALIEMPMEELRGSFSDASVAAVRLSYTGPTGAIVGRTYGVGPNPTFGYYAALEPRAHPIFGGIHWSVGQTVDTVLSVVNFGEEEDQATVELYHDSGAITIPPMLLAPLQSRTISLRSALAALGIVVPAGGLSGGYRASARNSSESAVLTKQRACPKSS